MNRVEEQHTFRLSSRFVHLSTDEFYFKNKNRMQLRCRIHSLIQTRHIRTIAFVYKIYFFFRIYLYVVIHLWCILRYYLLTACAHSFNELRSHLTFKCIVNISTVLYISSFLPKQYYQILWFLAGFYCVSMFTPFLLAAYFYLYSLNQRILFHNLWSITVN